MKQLLFLSVLVVITISSMQAQVYTGAAGLGLDFGEGLTLVGPSGKYFFGEHHAGQAELSFDDGVTAVTLLYQYHSEFAGASGLQWYIGAGPTIFLLRGDNSDVGIRPNIGLDYKINNVPLAFSADWRPYVSFDSGGSEAGLFALGFRYVFD